MTAARVPAMDFFERQQQARTNTGRLLLLYGMAVAGIVAAVHVVLAVALTHGEGLFNPGLMLLSLGGTMLVILIGVAVGNSSLSAGGSAVAELCGGRPLERGTHDPAERRYLNVVEEMAIASGVPMPAVFVLEEEEGINAFAAGHTTDDYAVAVSRGCLDQLTRDELQGVVAHEFSHILNGDMRRNIQLTGWLYGIMGLALVGRVLAEIGGRSSHSRSREGGQSTAMFLLLGLGLLIIGWVGQIFSRAIQAAISRQREYLADASAVQFTRNPAGIAGALKKIGGYPTGSTIGNSHASAFSHMFFASALDSLFATHPPLEERIRLLDPQFNPEIAAATQSAPAEHAASAALAPVAALRQFSARPTAPKPLQLRHASRLLSELPAPLLQAVEEPLGASAIVFALLLDARQSVREAQLRALQEFAPEAVRFEVARLHPQVDALPSRLHLPLATLATAALGRMSLNQYRQFRQCVDGLIEADAMIDLFEFALKKSLCRHLDPRFLGKPSKAVAPDEGALVPQCALLLSALSHLGQTRSGDQAAAFAAGAAVMNLPEAQRVLRPIAECNLAHLDAALDALAAAPMQHKQRLMEACATAVSHDGLVHEDEMSLLRAMGDALEHPLPPGVQDE